jgi:hypothetical protein
MLVAPLVVGVSHDDVRPFLPDDADQRPDRFLEWGRGEGAGLAARWHVRVPVAEHPDPFIAEMRCCSYQLLTADLRETRLHLRTIESRVQDVAGLTSGAANEHRAYPCRGIASNAAPSLGGLVVGVSMNREQATQARGWIAIDSEHFGLRGHVTHLHAIDGNL